MLAVTIKIVVTAVLVVAISEVAKRSTLLGAVLASLPLTSLLAMIWLYADTGDAQQVADLASGIFWLVLPSLVLFVALPLLLRARMAVRAEPRSSGCAHRRQLFPHARHAEALRHRHLTSRTVTGRARAAMPSPMLHINDLTYRIEGRPIFEQATAGIPTGHKVGLVGRNGAGKTTLLKLIAGELAPDMGSITMARSARIGHVAQEAPGGAESLIDWVLAADTERAGLLAEAEHASDPHRIAEIHERLTDIGAHAAPARAAQILAGLGFDEAAQQRPCGELSGGWRMRVALAAVLFLEPEILLLDEPTNYLDLEGALWLESYLRTYPHTVVIVSHDRDLLNRAVTAILHLDRGKLTLYSGGYDDFEEARREKQRLELKLKKKQDEERRRIQVFIDRFKAKATKAAQAQSRVKALAKMQPIAAQLEERVAPFHLPQPEKMLASPLMRIEEVSIGYAADAPVLTGAEPAHRPGRPHRAARPERQRQVDVRQADRRQAGAAVGQRLRRQARRCRAISPSTSSTSSIRRRRPTTTC